MKILITAFAFLFAFHGLIAQDSDGPANLGQQYDELKSSSNNYQIYKVVKETALDNFWNTVKDTLNSQNARIDALTKEVNGLNSEVSTLNAQVTERDELLENQDYQIETMEFLGIGLTKSSYIVFTWVLIFALLITALLLYYRFKTANSVTVSTRKEYEALQIEFDAHRQRTRENETKLKRDLQTELNRVEELKGMIGGDA